MRFKTIIICLLASLLRVHANGRLFCNIKEFAPNSGLVQRHVSNSLIDKSGFMWLATWNGLVRFDGYNFYTFKPTVYSRNDIYTNRVYNMKLNACNDLWCVSLDEQLYHFDTKLNLFTNASANIPGIRTKKVAHIFTLNEPVTWIEFKDGSCMRVNDRDPMKEYTLFAPGKLYPKGAKLHKVRKLSNGDEWMLTNKEAICYNSQTRLKGDYQFIFEVNGYQYLVSSKGVVTKMRNHRAVQTFKLWKQDLKLNKVSVKNGFAAIATSQGLAVMDVKRGVTRKYAEGKVVEDVQFDSKQRIWAFTDDNRMTLVNPQANTSAVLLTDALSTRTKRKSRQIILEDKDGCVIVKPVAGVLSYYDESTGTLLPVVPENGDISEIVPRSEISRYIVDFQHNLWCFHEERSIFISFNHEYFIHRQNRDRVETRAMLCDAQGREWISDRSNAVAVYRNNKSACAFLQPNGNLGTSQTAFTSSPIYSMAEDKLHRIWIGTKGEGVYLLTPKDDARTQYGVEHFSAQHPQSANGLDCDSIYALAADAQGNMWIGTYGKGLIRATTDAHGHTSFKPLKLDEEYNKVRTIKPYGRHALLVGTTAGLVSLDLRTGGRTKYYNTYRKEEWGLQASDVMEIVVQGSRIYLCVYGYGISEVTSDDVLTDKIHFKNTPFPNSAAADQIKAAVSDGTNIWVVAETALVKYMPDKKRYYMFDQDDFMSDIIFSEAMPVVNGNNVTVGTSDGVLCFDSETQPLAVKSEIVFTGIQYQNDMDIRPVNDLNKLTITPEQRSFSLYLSSLDYEGCKNIRYRYFLEGYDKNWNYADDGQHAVNYSNLPAGQYKLKVEATDANGTWGECRREIEVNVTPLFTETIWFRLFLALLAVGAVVGMVYAIIYLNKVRHVLQKKYSLLMTVEEVAPKLDKSAKTKSMDSSDKIIRDTVEYVNSNISQSNILIDNIARHLGMSRTAYYTRIKETTSLSPSDFIRQLRIRHALQLLKQGDLPISEVAFKVGFTDPKYFTKCFKAEMEMTPSQYVQQCKTEIKNILV